MYAILCSFFISPNPTITVYDFKILDYNCFIV